MCPETAAALRKKADRRVSPEVGWVSLDPPEEDVKGIEGLFLPRGVGLGLRLMQCPWPGEKRRQCRGGWWGVVVGQEGSEKSRSVLQSRFHQHHGLQGLSSCWSRAFS